MSASITVLLDIIVDLTLELAALRQQNHELRARVDELAPAQSDNPFERLFAKPQNPDATED